MIQDYVMKIMEELNLTLSNLSDEKALQLVERIISNKRIFISGTGRSGFALKAFAMRLKHLGLDSYVIGETNTPSVTEGDLLIVGSASGSTTTPLSAIKKADGLGTEVALFTMMDKSPMAELADTVVIINTLESKEREVKSLQPMGSLFEQSLLITLDAMILILMDKLNQSSKKMIHRHANLE